MAAPCPLAGIQPCMLGRGALQTGVTVLRPHRDDPFVNKVPAAASVIKGFGIIARGSLAHTINSFAFSRVAFNGVELGGAGAYGALAEEYGARVALLSGVDVFAEETAHYVFRMDVLSSPRVRRSTRAVPRSCRRRRVTRSEAPLAKWLGSTSLQVIRPAQRARHKPIPSTANCACKPARLPICSANHRRSHASTLSHCASARPRRNMRCVC